MAELTAKKTICHGCGREITNGILVVHRGMSYHLTCKVKEPPLVHLPFQFFEEAKENAVCGVCGKMITDTICIRYLKQPYHIQCMVNNIGKEKTKKVIGGTPIK
jgi:hypothetical protein